LVRYAREGRLMPYVKRDSDGKVDGVFSHPVAGLAEEELDAGHADIAAFEEKLDPIRPDWWLARVDKYPPIREQLDAIFHDIDAWKASIQAIKDAHPKGE